MGFGLDSIFGGGSQKVESKLPGYKEDAAKAIGYDTKYLVDQQTKNPLNATQLDAYNKLNATSGEWNPFIDGGTNFYNSLMSGNGLNDQQNNLAYNLTTGGAVNPAQSEVARVAMGGDVGANPYLNAAYNQAAQQVTDNFQKNLVPTMDRNFAATGRLGSNAYAQARNTAEQQTGKALGDLATNIYGGAYQSDMANKNAMLGQYAALGQQGIANQLAGAGLYQQGVGNQTTGVGLTPTLQGLRYDDATRQLQTGTSMQQAPWLPLQYGSSIINGLAAPTSQMQSTNTPIGSQLVGMGTGIAGLGTNTIGGAGLMSLFSDRRLKRNIRRIGQRDNGLPIYSYRYTWDEPGALRIGVMADEALAVAPEAVDVSGTYMAVDYARL